MSPYQPNSDALLPPPPLLPALPVDPLCLLPLGGGEPFFARTILSLFSDFAFAGLDFGFGDAFATSAFLGVGFAIGFGVVFALNAGVTLGVAGVAVAVGFGVDDGNSISLFAVVTAGFSSAVSSFSDALDSVAVGGWFSDGDSCFSDSSAEISPAPPNHTIFSGFDEVLAATLQRISPATSATCASAIRTTFRQKRPLGVPYLCEDGPFAI